MYLVKLVCTHVLHEYEDEYEDPYSKYEYMEMFSAKWQDFPLQIRKLKSIPEGRLEKTHGAKTIQNTVNLINP